MAQSYKIRLKRWNGIDFDTLNLSSNNVLMDSGVSVESAVNGKPDVNDTTTSSSNVWSSQKTSNAITNITTRLASITLASTSWTGSSTGPYTQTVTISGETITSKTKVDIQPDSTVLTVMSSDGIYGMYIQNNNGTLTAYSVGAKPTSNLTVQVSLEEVQ